jgi:hypothetical protein
MLAVCLGCGRQVLTEFLWGKVLRRVRLFYTQALLRSENEVNIIYLTHCVLRITLSVSLRSFYTIRQLILCFFLLPYFLQKQICFAYFSLTGRAWSLEINASGKCIV